MGTGWRRAFCTRDPESTLSDKQHSSHSPSPSPRSCARLNFFSGGSNPSTPRLQQQQSQPVNSPSLRCRTLAEAAATVNESPRFQSKTTPRATKSPKTVAASNPNSPRSPLKLSLFKNSFKFRVCMIHHVMLCFSSYALFFIILFCLNRVAVESA